MNVSVCLQSLPFVESDRIHQFVEKKASKFQSVTINVLAIPTLELHCTWEVEPSGDLKDPLFLFTRRPWPIVEEVDHWDEAPMPDMKFDAFKVQEEFFSVRTPREAEALFLAYGPWQISPAGQAQSIRFSDLIQIRKYYERALLSKRSFDPLKRERPKSWLGFLEYQAKWGPIEALLQIQEPPLAFVKCSDVQESVKASVILKKIDKLPYRRCARKGCRKWFNEPSSLVVAVTVSPYWYIRGVTPHCRIRRW